MLKSVNRSKVRRAETKERIKENRFLSQRHGEHGEPCGKITSSVSPVPPWALCLRERLDSADENNEGETAMRTHRGTWLLLFGLLVMVAGVGVTTRARGGDLVAMDIAQFFVEPDVATVLSWRNSTAGQIEEEPYTIRDYWRREVKSGTAAKGSDGKLQVEVKLTAGYYEIEFPKSSREFGIAAVPAYSGKRDMFFAIDAAMSWLVKDRAVRDGLVRVLERSGIGMSRERLAWRAISRDANQTDWETSDGYETMRQSYASHGIEVLEMCHDTPSWLGHSGKYPADLVAASRQWVEIAKHWQSTWGALEIWNEPDIFFGDDLPGDQYAAVVKSVVFGLQAMPFSRPIVGGVLANYHEGFLEACYANGMFECIDLLSFHTYSRAPDMESLVEKYRTWLERHGHAGMPLWLTECGRPWKKGPGRPPLDEDANSALDIIMKAVEARACGIARHFPFVYPYYEENDNNFGMMARNGDPLRCMAGYAQLVRAISHKQYLGDWKGVPESVQRARVFADDKQAVLILYTGKSDNKTTVPFDAPVQRLEGIDGRTLTATDKGVLPVPDGLVYVWLDRGQLDGKLNTETKARKLSQLPTAAKRSNSGPVVMRLELDSKTFAAETSGYRLKHDSTEPLPLKVRAFNLGKRAEQVQFEFEGAGELADGKKLQTLEIPAESSIELNWKFTPAAAMREAKRANVEVRATLADGSAKTSLVIVLLSPKN